MPEELDRADGRLENPSVRTEKSDANLHWILGLILGAVALGALVFCMVSVFFAGERARLDARRKSSFPLAPTPSRALPPEPRLEPLDRISEITSSNVYLREKAKLEILDSYGPTQDKGYIHIPIKQAMRLLAEQSRLPARVEAGPEVIEALGTLGLLASPAAPGPLLVAGSVFPGKSTAVRQALPSRENGLVDSGAANSGRMFNRRKPRWLEP